MNNCNHIPLTEAHLFFDIKNHLLPNTESFFDCAQDEDMAVCMAFDAYGQGCRFILATPPDSAFYNPLNSSGSEGIPPRISETYQSLCSRINRFLPDMSLGLGCEIHCSRTNIEEVVSHLKAGHYPTMNGTSYVLVSFPENVSRADLWFCLDRLDKAGYKTILSHAQNIQALRYDIHEIRCLKGNAERGPDYLFKAMIQLDTLSLHPSEQNHWSWEMIRSGVVDMLATNARNTFTNPPHIREEVDALAKVCSSEYLKAIAWGNAAQCFLRRKDFGKA